jgi:hypothetical protein
MLRRQIGAGPRRANILGAQRNPDKMSAYQEAKRQFPFENKPGSRDAERECKPHLTCHLQQENYNHNKSL